MTRLPNQPPVFYTEEEVELIRQEVAQTATSVSIAQIEGYKKSIEYLGNQRNLFGAILVQATGYGTNAITDSKEVVDEISRIFKLGRDFETILQSKASHPMLENLWENFVMAMRLCGEDRKPEENV